MYSEAVTLLLSRFRWRSTTPHKLHEFSLEAFLNDARAVVEAEFELARTRRAVTVAAFKSVWAASALRCQPDHEIDAVIHLRLRIHRTEPPWPPAEDKLQNELDSAGRLMTSLRQIRRSMFLQLVTVLRLQFTARHLAEAERESTGFCHSAR
jgi:hypothetical protein